ncbi:MULTISPECIES: DUF881 domain-containing protein [unclassified Bacillus (in: firmicutes)]|uniref:DUF881 domain-containing protein n=1 Tax=unclassified Bacillus (in: firmicutes) TaxID=185979 RepID=UPI0008F1D726|nr:MULTISPECIES: DUF881 domain-containing protein [unclassified Bacillus (in: firmicutes)]SFA75394.1 Uncharacterized conserved protein YlxW, UPF0749 family [Bacillus sp. UNCCL13]SFQ65498.1 Uncharacterized conserved protein YlxW, UPF0749 family [Bacillus sp. cl95]
MDKSKNISLTIITAVIGFMIAIQFQTVKEPVVRDTRDVWQLREALLKEKELQSTLIREIRSNEEKLAAYESKRKQSKEQVLRETLEELKVEAGLTEITGPGLVLTIEPIYEDIKLGTTVASLSPDLLKRMLNELNMYDAKHISVDGQRIINSTVIRDINGETKIDGHTLDSLPIDVKIVVEDMKTANKLYNRMQVSKSAEEFFIDNLRVTVSNPELNITVPAYENSIRIRNMQPVKPGEGGNT